MLPSNDFDIQSVYEAQRRISGIVYRTPLERSERLSTQFGRPVYLKLECWQRTRSFKIRGAYNAVASLSAETLARGLVAASAGNHGQGVALAARMRGVAARIFVPRSAPETKKSRIRSYGAELREVDGIYDDAEAAALAYAAESGATFVHPAADPRVAAGQGTIGLEILEELPTVREVVVPVGGGGLIAGIGTVMKAMDGVRVVGVQSERTRAMHAALAAGHPVEVDHGETLADGLAGGIEARGLAWVRQVADAVELVTESSIAEAIHGLYRHEGVVAEGAGATPAAFLETVGPSTEGPVVLVVSGGNLDADRLREILAE